MTRLPYLRRDELDERGQTLWDSIVTTRGDRVVNAEGGLAGPFNAWLHAQEVGERVADLGAVVRFGGSLDHRLAELAIITVGARWKAEFEWWAHSQLAEEQGIAVAAIDAISRGESYPFEAEDERVVHEVATQLTRDGRLAEDTYQEAAELLGTAGVVELVTLCGYYTLVAFTVNAFAVSLPPGVTATWETLTGD
jgi:4-carboxymuconolactone decarboxylase